MSANSKDMFRVWGLAFLASLAGWFRLRQADMLFVLLLLLLACSYFVTVPLLTDHTIPNSFYQQFPSPRIAAEARWGHEFIVQTLGGAGNQAVFNLLGMMALVINGFLFAELMDARSRTRRIIIAMLVAFSPILLSYFAFSSDALSFALGDMAALLGVMVLWRGPAVWSAFAKTQSSASKSGSLLGLIALAPSHLATALIAAGLFIFALSVYQPKLSLIACLVAFLLLKEASAQNAKTGDVLRMTLIAALTMALAVMLYWVSFQIISVLSDSAGYQRTQVNAFSEMVANAVMSYPEVGSLIAGFARTLPVIAGLALTALLFAGFVLLLWRSFRNGLVCALIAVALIALLPIGFRLSYVMNQETFPNIARVMSGLAYLPAFAAAVAMTRAIAVSLSAAVIVAYTSFILLVQETGAIAMKSWHESLMVNRIVARIEPLLQQDTTTSLVVLGQPLFDSALYVTATDRPLRPQTRKPAFISYRQVALTNFLIGKDVVTSPTAAQVAKARLEAKDRNPWPSREAVFRLDDMIVILLESNTQDVEATR